ncbi:uncharacterized protein FFB20_04909 [Fusarium fujikuroi]|nr:uncharacterized protein FFB20_04909 [Fusarium fujikuroi]
MQLLTNLTAILKALYL